jgi:hypothetical protein
MKNDRPWTAILAGAAGGAVAIAAMEMLAERTAVPLAFIPFATSIVMVMGSPEATPAQPRRRPPALRRSRARTSVGLVIRYPTAPLTDANRFFKNTVGARRWIGSARAPPPMQRDTITGSGDHH